MVYRYDPKFGGSSPRGRGTGKLNRRRAGGSRVIPAWAGNSRFPDDGRLSERVIPAWAGNSLITRRERIKTTGHPRVGGEQKKVG